MAATVPGIALGVCGPLQFRVHAEDSALGAVAESYFALYGRPWSGLTRTIDVAIRRSNARERAAGTFLSCAHMSVDRDGAEYLADTQYGFIARGSCARDGDTWTINVPETTMFGEPEIGDMEDLFSLMCTTGWREEGWVALHAGAVVKNETCAILCAGSGGGKSTLTTGLILSGWRTLGDDKILLRREDGQPQLRALLQTFNLDPATRRWFDLGDLEALPRYSAWTVKRRVPLDAIAPGAAVAAAAPTHVVRVSRNPLVDGVRATPMPQIDVLPTLLKQIVLPADRHVSTWIVREAISCLGRVRGVYLEIGDGAYASPGWLESIEAALR